MQVTRISHHVCCAVLWHLVFFVHSDGSLLSFRPASVLNDLVGFYHEFLLGGLLSGRLLFQQCMK